MSWSQLKFGKHRGKTLPQVLFTDADWFFWAYQQGILHNRGAILLEEATTIHERATAIRIPQSGAEKLVVEYALYPGSGKFCGFEVVAESRPRHEGSTQTRRSDHIDISVPTKLSSYDKLGCSLMIAGIKELFFGTARARITRKRAEDFFDNVANFHYGG